MLLYYRLMTKWSGLGDSTELSRVRLSHRAPLAPPLYVRAPRQAGVHRSERCAQAPVLDVGGPWSVPRATPARVGRPHRLAPLGARAAARRSLSLPYRDLPTIGRLRLPPPHAAQALKPHLFPPVQATRCRRPHGCRASTTSSLARFAAHMPPPSNSFHPQLHNISIDAPHLFSSSLNRKGEDTSRVFRPTLQGFESIDCRPLTVI
jgi:hypothetical protein